MLMMTFEGKNLSILSHYIFLMEDIIPKYLVLPLQLKIGPQNSLFESFYRFVEEI